MRFHDSNISKQHMMYHHHTSALEETFKGRSVMSVCARELFDQNMRAGNAGLIKQPADFLFRPFEIFRAVVETNPVPLVFQAKISGRWSARS